MTTGRFLLLLACAVTLAADPAGAALDIEDRGPTLRAGRFGMRITNAGIVGNAYFDIGRSFDPSFEFPRGSGQQFLNHAALWVGAETWDGERRVSGGPLLEWRPTLAPEDTVLEVWHGHPGTQQGVDDDGDGLLDEEILNAVDDDLDGAIDEDMALTAQQTLAADYVDDRPEAVSFFYGSETHRPLGLKVHQEAYAYSLPGYDSFAAVRFVITNKGTEDLLNVRPGLWVDLDARGAEDLTGHMNDVVTSRTVTRSIHHGTAMIEVMPQWSPYVENCVKTISRSVPVLTDASDPTLPAVGVVPLFHTIDPIGLFAPASANAPGQPTFLTTVYSLDRPAGSGGAPTLDADRYRALAGTFPRGDGRVPGDQAVLISCGPFKRIRPGESIEFALALTVGESADSVALAMSNAMFVHNGVHINVLPDSARLVIIDSPRDTIAVNFQVGSTGLTGHEVCLSAPIDSEPLYYDPHCKVKFNGFFDGAQFEPVPIYYQPGAPCIWTDADCDACTGLDGNETWVPWLDVGSVPPEPSQRLIAGDRSITIEWDNMPELLLRANQVSVREAEFVGYRVYLMGDWNGRRSEMPTVDRWALHSSWGRDSLNSMSRLAAITDTTLDYVRISYGSRQYPVGRYRITIPDLTNGFDVGVFVTTLAVVTTFTNGGVRRDTYFESPITARLPAVVAPRTEARAEAGSAWVVPNPYRARSPWERPGVPGDPLTRHVDFMGLPRARATIKIWTVAGDLVRTLEHDGRDGDGQASWDLISRNGQEIESGIYLFTIDSPIGQDRGRFVIIR